MSVHAIAVPVQPARQFGEAVFCETEELNRQNVPDSLLKCSAKWLEWRVGLEPIARYAAFLRAVGRTGEAKEMVEEIDRRAAKTAGAFRKEAQAWQDLATRG